VSGAEYCLSSFILTSPTSIVSYYLPIMLAGIGITDTNTRLYLNIVYSVVGWVFATVGARLHDVVGRRKMLITSASVMAACLAIVTGCSAAFVDYNNSTASTVSIVFIFLFGATFAVGFTPMQPIYPAEVVSNKMRAKGMGVFKLTAGAAGFLNTFVGPIALSSVSPGLTSDCTRAILTMSTDWLLVLRILRLLGHF
jgi:MFS family permease